MELLNNIKGYLIHLNTLIVILSFIFLIFLIKVPDITAIEPNLVLGAHRGSSVEYMENSLPAFESAVQNPDYNFIEFDIQYTKDKKIIVFHDYTLIRTYQKLGVISQLDYEEVSEKSNEQIPLFEEVIDIIGDKKKINIEIKPMGELEEKALVDYVVGYCKERGILKNVLISSISKYVVDYVSKTYPEIKTGIIYWVHPITYIPSESLVNEFYNETTEIGADYIMLHGINIKNYSLLSKLKHDDQILAFWYFNDQMFLVQKNNQEVLW